MNKETIWGMFVGLVLMLSVIIGEIGTQTNVLNDIRTIESEQRDTLNITYDMQVKQYCNTIEYKKACLNTYQ